MKNSEIRAFLEACLGEILPTLDFDPDEAKAYAAEVLNRFENPYIRHLCSAISLNSVSKFRVRVLPSILAYRAKFGTYPTALTYSFRRRMDFYRTGEPRDDAEIIEKMQREISEILADATLWGEDISDMTEAVTTAKWSRA